MRRRRFSPGIQLLAWLVAALYLVPMAYVLIASLTPDNESIGWLPSGLQPANYPAAWVSATFWIFLINSALVALASMLLQVLLSCSAGYALAKLPVPGRKSIMTMLIALLVVPPEIIMVPLFVMASRLPMVGGNDVLGRGGQGLIDTIGGLIIPHLVGALGIFLMRQFYRDLPDELGDSARVDGAGEFRIFARVYTPLVLPAVAVVAVLSFQSAWNDFLWPLVMTRSPERQTLQLGLTVFFQENSTRWNLLMAAVLLISIPVVALFAYVQRFFRTDVMSGALK
jgi:multiple sugar transport system permease protein